MNVESGRAHWRECVDEDTLGPVMMEEETMKKREKDWPEK